MRVHPINLNLQLPNDQIVDLFLFQWHTLDPLEGGTFHKIATPHLEHKRAVMEQFRDWFLGRPNPRLAFVILPEISVPLSCADVLTDLADRTPSPLVVIGGIEPLPWAEYLSFAASMVNTPEVERVGDGNPASLRVNTTGIWIRADDGSVLKFTQPKLHPSDSELPHFHKGENVIVFRSRDQSAHRRLNFCVQICSDFCSRSFVSDLRAAIGGASPGLLLDFLFLPQHNPDQEAAQFKESIEVYFDRTLPGVQTNEGCLVFVNNASAHQGKSSAYGGSRVYFPWPFWTLPPVPPPTYWLKTYTTYQAAIVRECGPGLYWFIYTPHCWVDRRPGAGNVLPFAQALFLAIERDHLETVPVYLWAETHWLRNEWVSGRKVFVDKIRDRSAEAAQAETKANSCGDAYMECTGTWCDYFAVQPEIAKEAILSYFRCWGEGNRFPKYPASEAEPNRWCGDVSRGVTRFMQTYCLLKLGAPSTPPGMRPDCDKRGWHAAIGDSVVVVFVWGNGDLPAKALIQECRKMWFQVTLLRNKVLLVLVDPEGNADPNQLRDDLQINAHSVSNGDDLEGLPENLQPDGVVVDASYERRLNMVNNHMLLQEAYGASSEADLGSRLAGVLRTELQ